MKKIEPYPIASALLYIFSILYIICIGIKLLLVNMGIEGVWHMHKIWGLILPGFDDLKLISLLIGLLEVSIGAYIIGYITVPLYNFLIRSKVREKKVEVRSIKIRFKVLFSTFATTFSILFTICLLYDLVVPVEYQMLPLWKILLPGFEGLSLIDFLIGLADIFIYSAYTSFIFAKTINYFEKTQLLKAGEKPIS